MGRCEVSKHAAIRIPDCLLGRTTNNLPVDPEGLPAVGNPADYNLAAALECRLLNVFGVEPWMLYPVDRSRVLGCFLPYKNPS
ncbi:hypothetical protein CHARACLAT_025486 [Characodon lateralis]|uniref:Uncharacterized protein n=1 Tax=Characodon lateralis TaxID=208331 RepID=A0ABU7DU38_9TELE|nr:hypothetical protein [Characodon lateralis]